MGKTLRNIFLSIIIFLLSGPLVVVCGVSLNAKKRLFFPPEGLSLRWYVELLTENSWLIPVKNSLTIAFASSLGVGVFFSFLIVLIFQGTLTLLGSQLTFLVEPRILNELTATGGLMILGIGFYLLDIKRVKVGNFLPGLVFAVILALIFK